MESSSVVEVHVEGSAALISIVTPSFNQVQFLEETLRSVELQRYRPIHQIVIDGGSKDGTVDLLKEWEARDHGAGYTYEWISEPDRGHADALNKGFDRVRGELVGWLNSDDVYFDRQVLTRVAEAFAAHREVDMVHGEVALISAGSGLQMVLCYPKFDYDRALRGYIVSQPTVFLRRSVTDRYRLDPTLRIAIDHVYWLQMGRDHVVLKLNRILAGDRDHGSRISRVSSVALAQASKDSCKAFGAPEKPGKFRRAMDLFWLRYYRAVAVFHLLRLLVRGEMPGDLAFPCWIDSVPEVLARQLTMRVNNRGGVGPNRAVTTSARQ